MRTEEMITLMKNNPKRYYIISNKDADKYMSVSYGDYEDENIFVVHNSNINIAKICNCSIITADYLSDDDIFNVINEAKLSNISEED